MPTDPDRRCETCEHWKHEPMRTWPNGGTCLCPLPIVAMKHTNKVDALAGADCPCYQRKDETK